MRTAVRALGLLLLAWTVVPACSAEDDGPATHGDLALAVQALTGSDVTFESFRLRLFDGTPADLSVQPIYDSACIPFGNQVLVLRDMPVGDDYAAYFEGFAGDACAGTAIARGFRGGIHIGAGNSAASGYYYIPVYPVGRFVELPSPPNYVLDELAALTAEGPCESDADCWQCEANDACRACPAEGPCPDRPSCCGYRQDGLCCHGHPRAACVAGACTLDTLFPLNVASPRAFHRSVALPDGRVVLVGGFTAIDPNDPSRLVAEDRPSELFDPQTGLFKRILSDADNAPRGLVEATAVAGGRIALAGGARSVALTFEGAALRLSIPEQYCPAGATGCESNFPAGLWVVDYDDLSPTLDADGAEQARARLNASLSAVLLYHRMAWVEPGGGTLVITGGSGEPGQTITPSSRLFLCTIAGLGADCRLSDDTLHSARATHADLCLSPGKVGCNDYLVVGGVGNHSDAHFAERFDPGDRVFRAASLGSSGSPFQRAMFPQVAWAGSAIEGIKGLILHGGAVVADNGGVPDINPALLGYDTTNDTVSAQVFELPAPETAHSLRVFNRLVRLSDGRALSVGGLDATGRVQKRVVVFTPVSDGGVPQTQFLDLNRGRVGHDVAVVQAGLLKGAVIVSGGITFDSTGQPSYVRGAEILLPE